MRKLTLALLICMALSTVASASMLRETWSDQVTGNLDEAIAVVNGEVAPDMVEVLADSAWTDRADNYVAKLSGWVVAPADGEYTFYVSSDDHSGLWLSPDADPAGAEQIAFVDGWTGIQAWWNYDSQKSAPVALVAGEVRAIYAIMREGGGGDNCAIGWTGPGIADVTLLGANATHLAYKAGAPSPADGATGIRVGVASWMAPPLVEAPVYAVYAGTDPEALELLAGDLTETTVDAGAVGAGLDPDTTYYWRVDVNGEAGDVWSFTTETALPIITSQTAWAGPAGADAQLAIETESITGAEVTYQWYQVEFRMGDIIIPNVPIGDATSNVLDMPAVMLTSEGEYYCIATNSYGDTQSDNLMLDVQVGIIHRYTFDESPDGTTVPDVVGGADATLVNNTGMAFIMAGQALLGNDGSQNSAGGEGNTANGDYIDLPNGMVSSLTQMTIECWATWNDDGLGAWQRLFDIGTSNDGEDVSPAGSATTYLMFAPKDGGVNAQLEYRVLGAAAAIVPGGMMALHEETMVTVLHDDKADVTKLYINGVAQGIMNAPTPLKTFDDNNVWIGRSQWGDTLFIGSINEFRVYDTALSAEQIAADYLAGADALGELAPAGDCEGLIGDKNGDCVYDFVDVAILADQFMTDAYNAQQAD